MDQQKTGRFLKQLRQEKGLTQEQVAEQFNVAGRTVSRWETGSSMPDLSLLVDIATFYGVNVSEIINGERKHEDMETKSKTPVTPAKEQASNKEPGKASRKTLLWAAAIFFILVILAWFAGNVIGEDLGIFIYNITH